jgi:hypothetical protein
LIKVGDVFEFFQVACPSCSRNIYFEGIGLAECESCAFVFCTNCKKDFHGSTECGTLKVLKKSSVEKAGVASTSREVR